MPKPGWTARDRHRPLRQAARSLRHASSPKASPRSPGPAARSPTPIYDEFVFRGSLAADLAPGATLYFPVVQKCTSATDRWIEIPAAGQDREALELPAPGLTLLPAAGGGD